MVYRSIPLSKVAVTPRGGRGRFSRATVTINAKATKTRRQARAGSTPCFHFMIGAEGAVAPVCLRSRTPALRLQIQVGDAFVPYMESHQEHGPEHQQRQEHAFLPPLNPALDIGTFSSGNPSPVLKNAVQISHLPPYFPEDDFGRNSGRNEKYAMTRLVALREHQQTLGYLLHRLPICAQSLVKATPLLHPNLAKDQEFTIRITPEAPESYSPHDDVGPDMSSDEQIRLMVQPPTTSLSSTLSTDPRESYPQGGSNLLQEYRTALMELWQVDQNLCHYLSRYIRTTRKNRRCLEFILGTTELLPKTTPVQGSKANVQQGSTRRMMTPVTPTLGPVHVSSFARHGAEQKHALHASATTTPTTSPSLVPYPSPKAINSPRAQASSQLNGAENTVVLDDEQIHTFSRHYDQVSSTELISPATPGFSPYGNNMAGSGPVGERPFKDYDEIEAAVLVGHHLACLQKANKLTEMFNEESRRSQGILERFEDARDAYESAIYGEQ
ncbi:hypothetical protein BGX28_007388 [Mortierella sp. GBA30]|nr:hypothetical protein BGX28_007388 [Mortierella sp. GBA30]